MTEPLKEGLKRLMPAAGRGGPEGTAPTFTTDFG